MQHTFSASRWFSSKYVYLHCSYTRQCSLLKCVALQFSRGQLSGCYQENAGSDCLERGRAVIENGLNASRGRQAGSHSLKWPPSTLLPSIALNTTNSLRYLARLQFHLPWTGITTNLHSATIPLLITWSHCVWNLFSILVIQAPLVKQLALCISAVCLKVGGKFKKSSVHCTILRQYFLLTHQM